MSYLRTLYTVNRDLGYLPRVVSTKTGGPKKPTSETNEYAGMILTKFFDAHGDYLAEDMRLRNSPLISFSALGNNLGSQSGLLKSTLHFMYALYFWNDALIQKVCKEPVRLEVILTAENQSPEVKAMVKLMPENIVEYIMTVEKIWVEKTKEIVRRMDNFPANMLLK